MDLLVYLQMVYITRHASSLLSLLPNGDCIAARSTVTCHLRMPFKKHGRGDQWDKHSRTGNFAASPQMQQWSRGDEKVSIAAGFQTTSAVPLQEAKVKTVLIHLHEKLSGSQNPLNISIPLSWMPSTSQLPCWPLHIYWTSQCAIWSTLVSGVDQMLGQKHQLPDHVHKFIHKQMHNTISRTALVQIQVVQPLHRSTESH